jgi:nucleoside transporter
MTINFRLGIMMFLQFFVWGGWYVTVGSFMKDNNMEAIISWAYSVSPIAAIISPFFLGFVADRYFNAEKILGILHILSGCFLLLTPLFTSKPTIFILMLAMHMICYMPTLGLANSVAFRHVDNQEKQFPLIRVFGTLGWIVVGILVSGILHADKTATPFYIAGAAGIFLGFYSFILPKTPPLLGKDALVSFKDIIGLNALNKLKSKSFFVFALSSFLICIPLAAYYSYAPIFVGDMNIEDVAAKMTLGQMSEVLFMLILPLLFARYGVKYILLGGMLAWAVRYVLFAVSASTGTISLVFLGIIFHGICYDLFFVAGQVYVDKKSTADIRSQAQGFLVLITYGLGMFVGAQVAGYIYNLLLKGQTALSVQSWQQFWLVFAVMTTVVIVYFFIGFKDKLNSKE